MSPTDLLLLPSQTLQAHEDGIVYYGSLARLLGGVKPAILFSQLWYGLMHFPVGDEPDWKIIKRANEGGGQGPPPPKDPSRIGKWFWRNLSEIGETTGLTTEELRGAARKLEEFGVVKRRQAGLEHRTYWLLDIDKLDELARKNPVPEKPGNGNFPARENPTPGAGNFPGPEPGKSRTLPIENQERTKRELTPDRPVRRTRPPSGSPTSDGKMTRSPRHQNIRDRTDRFLPIAERLASLIRTKKNVKVPRARLKAWANDCRLLEEEDGVVFHRQRRVLRAYEPIYGGEYVPVVECGMTWRKKFLRVEEAIGRRKNGNGSRRPGGARRDPRSDPYPTGTRINYSEDPS